MSIDATFLSALEQAISKVAQFYTEKEAELLADLDHISFLDIDIDEQSTASTSVTIVDDLSHRLIHLYVALSTLKSYVYVNEAAITNILAKYDKHLNATLHITHRHLIETSYPFRPSTRQHLDTCIKQVEQKYDAAGCSNKDELAQCLRDHMQNQQQHQQPAPPSWPLKKTILLCLFLAVFGGLIGCPSFFDQIEQRLCFAILVFASLLWATELFPLFVTALLVPFLAITLRVIRSPSDGTRLSAMEASKVVFASMLSPVIMLLLGGFAIAAALNKYGIAKSLASFVLSKATGKPSSVLFVHMLVASMASMWISNVAAPVLCLSLIQPILRSLPSTSTFGPCLIMGIALASNLGGIASPIASPQNVIAIQNMSPPPSWTDWFCVSVPLCLLGNSIVWAWLLTYYQVKNDHPLLLVPTPTTAKMSRVQMVIVGVTLLTIVLWCIAHTFRDTLGDMGVIAIIPLVAFFGAGILTKDEFNGFLWNVVVLAMGGIALGKAVESSGLLFTIASRISEQVMGLSTFEVLFVFCSLVLIMATFISHTVAALIVLPIVAKIGTQLPDPNPRILVMVKETNLTKKKK